MATVVVLLFGVAVPAAGQGQEVGLPPPGETRLEVLDDGRRVWVVHHDDGDVDVLDVAAERLDPAADPFVYGSAFSGIRSFTVWIPAERIFLGPAVVYDDRGTALSWSPNQVGGAEDAGPVPARDLAPYDVQRLAEDRIRIGDLPMVRSAPCRRAAASGSLMARSSDR